MVWSQVQQLRRWLWRSRGALTAGFMLLNLGLLHPLLCVLHCEILLRANLPLQTGHVHGGVQRPARHLPTDHRPITAVKALQPAMEHQDCEVLPPAVYALILSLPLVILMVLTLLWRAAEVVHIRSGQHLRPPIPPPIALLS